VKRFLVSALNVDTQGAAAKLTKRKRFQRSFKLSGDAPLILIQNIRRQRHAGILYKPSAYRVEPPSHSTKCQVIAISGIKARYQHVPANVVLEAKLVKVTVKAMSSFSSALRLRTWSFASGRRLDWTHISR